MNFPEELKIEAAEAYRQNILVPGIEHVKRNDWMDAWGCGVTYQIKKQKEEDGINNLCQDCVAGEAMLSAPRCRRCDNGSMFKAREEKMTTRQYCRYCAFCFQADEDEFRCSAEINGQQLYMTRKQINRAKTCPEFALSELGDVVTGKQYQPKQERQEDNSQPELF